MAQYDTEQLAIERRRAIAKALRDSGNVAFDPAASAGRLVYARSPWEDVAKVFNQGMAGYQEGKADKLTEALMKRRAADTEAGIQGSMDALVGKSNVRPDNIMTDSTQVAPIDLAGPDGQSMPFGGGEIPGVEVNGFGPAKEQNDKRALLAGIMKGVPQEQALQILQGKAVEKALPARQPLMQVSDGGSIFDPNTNTMIGNNAKDAKPAPNLQHTDSGLNYNPATGEYTDSEGRKLSSEEVLRREIRMTGERAGATTRATDAAKVGALPAGSIEAMVEQYMQDGKVPTGATRNPVISMKFWGAVSDRAAKDGKPLAVQIAETRRRAALAPALSQTQKQLAANNNFLETLHKNIDAADEYAKRVGGDDPQFLNNVFNKWKRGVTGDPDVAQFDVFNNAIIGESAKISSGGVGSVSASSDTQMEKNAKLLNSAQTYKQWRAAVDAMNAEGANRINSIKGEMDNLTAQSANTGPTPAPANPAAPPATPPVTKVIGGVTYVKTGPGPNDWEAQ